MSTDDSGEVTFSSVFIEHPEELSKKNQIRGSLVVFVRDGLPFLKWQPAKDELDEWLLIEQKNPDDYEFQRSIPNGEEASQKYVIMIPLNSIKCIQRPATVIDWPFISITTLDNTTLPYFYFHTGGIDNLIRSLKKYICINRSKSNGRFYYVTAQPSDALMRSLTKLNIEAEPQSLGLTDALADPDEALTAAMSGFSKMKNFVFDNLLSQSKLKKSRPSCEIANVSDTSFSDGMKITPGLEPGYDLVTVQQTSVRPTNLKRGTALTAENFKKFFDDEGRIVNIPELKNRIFRGGVTPQIRPLVWKYLLGYYKFDRTSEENEARRKVKEEDYYRMKLQWKTLTDSQLRRFADMRERKSLVEKDVIRTDRTHPFYAGAKNNHLTILYDILMTSCMYNFDLGYVQGMSDLLSPLLMLFDDEVDAFWCLVGFLKRVSSNFDLDQAGMRQQLEQLKCLLNFLLPDLYVYFESQDSGNLYFCFRWLLILFKREFSFGDIMKLWEVLWTDLPGPNFHLFVCVAILDLQKSTIMENKFNFEELLQYINNLSCCLDIEKVLIQSEAIYYEVLDARANLPPTLRTLMQLDSSSQHSDSDPCEPLNSSSFASIQFDEGPLSLLIPSPHDSSIEVLTEDT